MLRKFPINALLFSGLLIGAHPAFGQVQVPLNVVAQEVANKSAEGKKDDPKEGDSKSAKAEESKEKAADPKEGAPMGEPKIEEPTAVRQRPLKPNSAPNPDELRARPDDGKVRFNFRGQSWPDVLNWLAEISEMSFDWQELPGDYLNLVTQRSYTIEEARDLVNRHLLARGYTMLENDELLTVVNVKKLDAGMVPRVEPRDLMHRRPHEFVKVSFPLEWIVAESAVDELKPMLSPNGRLTSLKSTNRLEAMDAVTNLREIYKVIGQEQSDAGQEKLVREFDLQHAKATEVQQQLQKLLGIEDRQAQAQLSSRDQMQMFMQQQQEMMQQMQRGKSGASGAPQQKVEINLVVNVRRNSILARANPEKMAVIGQAIKMLDVPLEQSQTISGSLGRMQVYRLTGLEPAALVKTLEESGGLDPTTRLQVDEKNKAIIAHASLADHVMIRKVIEKLDGSNRKFEVISLRKLSADYVAGSIEFMFNGGNEEKQAPRRSYYGGYDYDSRRSGSQTPENPDKFRVDADSENNRLLMWANEMELQEVRNLLTKLGEITDPRDAQGNASRVRVLSIHPKDAEEWLNRLRRTWPTVAPNPLIAPPPKADPSDSKDATEPGDEKPADATERTSKQTKAQSTEKLPQKSARQSFVRLAQLRGDEKFVATEGAAEPNVAPSDRPGAVPPRETGKTEKLPPVRVDVGPDGRLIISSQDTAALDLLEELADDLAPDRKDYQVFQLKHAPAFWVKMNLVEFFEEEDKSKKDTGRRNFYYFEPPAEKKEPRQRLSKRKQLRFISDSDTNTIVVMGADAQQSKTITELVDLYDKPVITDTKTMRMTTTVQIQYSTAKAVADAVKEVYRDLLSSNDKALMQAGVPANQAGHQQTGGSYIGDSSSSSGSSGSSDKRTKVSFKGKLSLGIDEVSNTLLISADGENLLNNVLKMVESLDEAAKPNNSIQVVKLGDGINSLEVRRVLTGLLADQAVQSATNRTSNGSTGQQRPAGNGNGNAQRSNRNGR